MTLAPAGDRGVDFRHIGTIRFPVKQQGHVSPVNFRGGMAGDARKGGIGILNGSVQPGDHDGVDARLDGAVAQPQRRVGLALPARDEHNRQYPCSGCGRTESKKCPIR